jgi:uncharacterized protein YecE (DUF72 family)
MVEDEERPMFDRATADFVYLRLRRAREAEPAGYPEAELDAWAAKLKAMAAERDVFAYVINGAKVRAPAAAMALLARLSGESGRGRGATAETRTATAKRPAAGKPKRGS